MQKPEKILLSTRPLPKAVIEEGARQGVAIEELSFIDTRPVTNDELFAIMKRLAAEEHTIVFTSMNAVEAVAGHVTEAPHWKIYAIGNTTRQLVEKAWGVDKLVATADDARLLGERLIDDGVREVVFFCGDRRRDELPNKIRSEGGRVEEIVVYETEETPSRLTKEYDGILFFSPSAVASFFRQNQPSKHTVCFAIGATTKEALRQKKVARIVVAAKTDKVEMAQEAIAYLTQSSQKIG